MKRFSHLIALATVALSLSGLAHASAAGKAAKPDLAAGEAKAAACMACHDNAALPSEPFLHGQKAAYLTEQIKAFRDGKRKNAVMEAMTKPLSDADITAIAEHFSRLAPVAPVAATKK